MFVLTFIFATIIAFAQSVFVPSFTIIGGFPDLLVSALMVFLFLDFKRQTSLFVIVSSIVVSILTEAQVAYFLLPYFSIILLYNFLYNRRIIYRPSVMLSLPIIFLSAFMINLMQLIISQNLSIFILGNSAISSFLTAIIGSIFYYLFRRLYFFFNPQILKERIKISNL